MKSMETKIYRIAALLTCHNRREKTVKSMAALFASLDNYNARQHPKASLKVFLTDDGCTDHTAETVLATFTERDITIVKADGAAFWSGGMRRAWQAAADAADTFDFFLLLNDDTLTEPDGLETLLETDRYSLSACGRRGVYTGIISSLDGSHITYGGSVYTSRLLGRSRLLQPSGTPQACPLTNANLMLVSREAYEKIGMLDAHYVHRCSDWAYGQEAWRHGVPVFTTPKVCGRCDNDHLSPQEEEQKLLGMTLRERRRYFFTPPQSTQDILYYMRRYFPLRGLLVLAARAINILAPRFYYKLVSSNK